MTATSACPGMRSSSERTTVVLPVPTSPVSWMNPPASLMPYKQVRERLRVPLAHEEIARIGGDCEGLLAQPEKARVHAECSANRGKDDARRAQLLQRAEAPGTGSSDRLNSLQS